jgi:cytochrome c oxidase subunit 2
MITKLPAPSAGHILALSLSCSLTGCGGSQSSLDPQGPEAARLSELFWYFTSVCGAVWLGVLMALAWVVYRPLTRSKNPEPLAVDAAGDQRASFIVGGLVAATAVILVVLTLWSYLATRRLAQDLDNNALRLEVTGYQWWWDVSYDDQEPTRTFSTANEIHVPIGKRVRIKLKAADVIHSFWVPNLAGKQDLIPGQENEITFTVANPGIYRGQCAEFCGLQHAHMALLVIADPPDVFEAWRNEQIEPAHIPSDPKEARGERVFDTHACMMCHTIRGTDAGGRSGPDLTHFGRRKTIAAASLPNDRGTLAAWIANPEAIKPGNKMPMVPLNPDELDALTAYLEALR